MDKRPASEAHALCDDRAQLRTEIQEFLEFRPCLQRSCCPVLMSARNQLQYVRVMDTPSPCRTRDLDFHSSQPDLSYSSNTSYYGNKENIYETLRPYLIKYNCRRVLRHTVTYDTACYKYDGALAGRGGRGRAGARAVVRTSRVLPRALVLPIPRQDQVCFPTVTCILFSPTDQIALEPGPALHDRRQHCGWVLRC